MVSEEKTKHLVLADLGIDPNQEYSEFHLIIQGVKESEYPEIEEILKEAGGKNQEFKGKGKPEYIIRLKNEEKVLLVEFSGVQRNKLKISFGIWKKGEDAYQFIEEQTKIFPWKEYFVVQKEGEKPIDACLLALDNKNFRKGFYLMLAVGADFS
ncbi:5626_t:CDS:2, partial [Racocetra persica]